MKLDMDCVRDVLLNIESQNNVLFENGMIRFNEIRLEAVCSQLPNWSKEQVFYSLFNLEQAGFINMYVLEVDAGIVDCIIHHITYEGHEFLGSIRDSTTWKKVKSGLSAVRNYSLSAISAIAEGVTSAAITAFLSHNQ